MYSKAIVITRIKLFIKQEIMENGKEKLFIKIE